MNVNNRDLFNLQHSFLEDKPTINKVIMGDILQKRKQRLTNNNQVFDITKKKKKNCLCYNIVRHCINDCKHKKGVEKKNVESN
jgi:hypothetical protein